MSILRCICKIHFFDSPSTIFHWTFFYIIMQLLTQYELSCILIDSLQIYYQFMVCPFTKYGAVHRASNKKSERFGSKFESKQSRNALQDILSLYYLSLLLCIKGYHLCVGLGYLNRPISNCINLT